MHCDIVLIGCELSYRSEAKANLTKNRFNNYLKKIIIAVIKNNEI